jgi:hypothetical protein
MTENLQTIKFQMPRQVLNTIIDNARVVDTGNCCVLMCSVSGGININLGIIEVYDPTKGMFFVQDKGIYVAMNELTNVKCGYDTKTAIIEFI